MNIDMYIYICMNIYKYIHTHVYIYIYSYMHTYIYMKGLPHNEESLLGILNFIFCLCINEDGLRLVMFINPFPLILSSLHDLSLLRMEDADIPLLLSDTPSRIGEKLGNLYTHTNSYICERTYMYM
jgi:hypothetical protein